MNVITLIGRLCQSPELKQTQSGKSVVTVNVAVDRPFAKDITDFIPVIIWNQTAEYVSRYASKGAKVGICGKLTTRKYEDKNGNKCTAFEVVADTVEICGVTIENATEAKNQPPVSIPTAYTSQPKMEEIPTDIDLPF